MKRLLLLLAVFAAGCEMQTNEVIAAIKECEKADMIPKQYFNGFTMGTRKIVCVMKKEK